MKKTKFYSRFVVDHGTNVAVEFNGYTFTDQDIAYNMYSCRKYLHTNECFVIESTTGCCVAKAPTIKEAVDAAKKRTNKLKTYLNEHPDMTFNGRIKPLEELKKITAEEYFSKWCHSI